MTLAQGYEASWFPAVLGGQLMALGALGVADLLPARGARPPAEEVGGAVALPLRRGFAVRRAAVTVVLASLVVPVAVRDGGVLPVVLAAVALLVGAGLATWWVTIGADRSRVRLDPEAITVPAGLGPATRMAWRDVDGAQALRRWQPLLVVIPKREPDRPLAVRLLPQAWSPESLTALIEYYADHAGSRSDLTSAAAVDRFRDR